MSPLHARLVSRMAGGLHTILVTLLRLDLVYAKRMKFLCTQQTYQAAFELPNFAHCFNTFQPLQADVGSLYQLLLSSETMQCLPIVFSFLDACMYTYMYTLTSASDSGAVHGRTHVASTRFYSAATLYWKSGGGATATPYSSKCGQPGVPVSAAVEQPYVTGQLSWWHSTPHATSNRRRRQS